MADFSVRLDLLSNIPQTAQLIINNLVQIKQEMLALGEGNAFQKLEAIINGGLKQGLKESIQEVNRYRQAIEELTKAQNALKLHGADTAKGRRAAVSELGPSGRGVLGASTGKTSTTKQFRSATADEIKGALASANAGLKLNKQLASDAAAEMEQLASVATVTFQKITQETAIANQEIAQLTAAAAGGALKKTTSSIANEIEQEIAKIQDQLRQLEESSTKQLNPRFRSTVDKSPRLLQEANAHRKEATKLEGEIKVLTDQAAGSLGDAVATSERLNVIAAKRLRSEQLIADAISKERRASESLSKSKGARTLSGVQQEYEELQRRLERLLVLQRDVFSPDYVERNLPALHKQNQIIKQTADQLKQTNLPLERKNELIRQGNEALKEANRLTKEATAGVVGADGGAFGEKRIQRNVQAQMPGINRLFTNVFTDMSRRFTATLQFAISGALIFGVQKFVREFITAAIEVERAFKDIESALEFDIDFERGSVEFNRQVELVRRDVLLLAREFNILPTEANKAAFVMVSRFQDVDNAMLALRSQLIATKVSGIDQVEVLRALTATAEAFAAEVVITNSAMSVQERLFARETASARLYGEALDLAVQIQQKFGVEVEDTLEGVARAAPVFRQMGFTMEQTAAIVAGSVRSLGQTGQQVAERLNRSLGQLTDPKIRDALLDLSGVTENFTLNISDFENGATAWAKIADEFERLEDTDPAATQKILQIVGQRRELEAVAAALASLDTQDAIVAGAGDAAGAADQRFSFLSSTIAEILLSIASGFEEMAQGFEKLGGVTALKLFLSTLDTLVTVLNDVLELIIDVKDILDKFPLGPLGTAIIKFGSLGLAIAGVLRVAIALKETFKELAVTQSGAIFSRFLATSGAASGAGAGLAGIGASLRSNFKPSFAAQVSASRGGSSLGGFVGARGAGTVGVLGRTRLAASSLGQGLKGATAATGAFSASALAMIPVWGQIAAVVLGAGLALKSLKDRTDDLAQSFEQGTESIEDAGISATKNARQEGLSGLEFQRAVVEDELAAARTATDAAPSGVPGLLNGFGAVLQDFTFGGKESGGFGDFGGGGLGRNSAQIFADGDHPELVRGSEEFFREQLIELLNKAGELEIEALRNVISESGKGLNLLPTNLSAELGIKEGIGAALLPDLTDVVSLLGVELSPDFTGLDVQAVAEGILERATREAEALLSDDTGTPAEREARAKEARAIMAAAEERVAGIIDFFSGTIKSQIDSVSQLEAEFAALDNDIRLGRKTPTQANDRRKEISDLIHDAANFFRGIEEFELADQLDVTGEDFYIEYLNKRVEIASTEAARATQNQGQRRQLAAQAAVLYAELLLLQEELSDGGLYGINRKDAEALAAGSAAYKAVAEQVRAMDRALKTQLIRDGISRSRTFAESRSLREDLIAELKRQTRLAHSQGRDEDEKALENEAEDARREQAQLDLDEAIQRKQNQIRLSSPILSQRAKLESALVDAKTRLIAEQDPTKADSLRVKVAELEASGLQQELQRITALTLSKVAIRDAINQQHVQIAYLRQVAVLNADLFGKTSKEYYDATIAIAGAEAAMIDMILSLESINRQLSGTFDVTNPLHAAEEQLITISRNLQAALQSGGELEIAQLRLQKEVAEAARVNASFNEGLFNLKFQFERGDLGLNEYIKSLRGMLDAVDISTHQGKTLWLQINSLIEGLTDDISGAAFNIPGEIRIPTLFEVRRAVQAEALGVNYMDNRKQDINVYVSNDMQLDAVMKSIEGVFDVQDASMAPGGAGITMGVF